MMGQEQRDELLSSEPLFEEECAVETLNLTTQKAVDMMYHEHPDTEIAWLNLVQNLLAVSDAKACFCFFFFLMGFSLCFFFFFHPFEWRLYF